MEFVRSTLVALVDLLREAAPGFLVGTALAAALQLWLKPETARRWIGTGSGSLLKAAAAGAILPGCAVTTIPLAVALRQKGMPIGTLTAFIMIAPILSPHTVALTAVMLGPEMTVGRLVLPFGLSLALGAVLNRIQRPARPAAAPVTLPLVPPLSDCGCDDCHTGAETGGGWRGFLSGWAATVRDLVPYLAGGLTVVALLQVLLPADWMSNQLSGGFFAYAAAAGAGLPLYVCEGGEVPLTRALLELGVGLGPAFTFLLASVGTCFPTLAMSPKIIGWRPTLLYAACWILLSVGGGLLLASLSSR